MGKIGAIKAGKCLALFMSLTLGATVSISMPAASARSHHKAPSHGVKNYGSLRTTRHHISHHGQGTRHSKIVTAKPRYAYPIDIFMARPPEFDQSPLNLEAARRVRSAFDSGVADSYPPAYLVRAGVVNFYSLRGGIYKRREPVKYVIVHSTETGVPQDARHVIDAWSSLGRRHAGAQYLVDRDGTIYECCDPELATVHVNIFKTLPGINNDNSVGIEMCHAGSQSYPPEQRASVTRLVAYLQDRYHVLNANVITHRYAQQGDHTDPVNFDFDAFLATKDSFRDRALAMKHTNPPVAIVENDLPTASVYLQMHKTLKLQDVMQRRSFSPRELKVAEQRVNAYFMSQNIKTTRGSMVIEPAETEDFQESLNRGTALSTRARGIGSLRGAIELPPDSAGIYDAP